MSANIPVNPEYDWAVDPQLQPDYFNPVTVNNKVIYYANKLMEVTGTLTALNKEIAAVKLKLRQGRTRKDDIEYEIIASEELSREQTKNTTTLVANVRAKIRETKFAEEYSQLLAEVRAAEEQLEILTVRADNWYRVLDALKLVSQNIQTALSFYKAEMKTMR